MKKRILENESLEFLRPVRKPSPSATALRNGGRRGRVGIDAPDAGRPRPAPGVCGLSGRREIRFTEHGHLCRHPDENLRGHRFLFRKRLPCVPHPPGHLFDGIDDGALGQVGFASELSPMIERQGGKALSPATVRASLSFGR